MFAFVVPLTGIIVAEGFLYYDRVAYGMVTHAIILGISVLGAQLLVTERNVLGALALVPMFRLVNIGLPIFTDVTLVWLLLFYGSILPGLYWYLLANPSIEVSLVGRPTNFVLSLPFVILLSIFLAEAEFEVLRPGALIPAWQPPYVLVLGIVMIVFVSLTEELLFRGILQAAFVERFGWFFGILLASVVFGVAHAGYGTPLAVEYAVIAGLVLGFIYHLTDSLGLVVLCHGLLNVLLFGLLPLLGPIVGRFPIF